MEIIKTQYFFTFIIFDAIIIFLFFFMWTEYKLLPVFTLFLDQKWHLTNVLQMSIHNISFFVEK